MRSLERKVALVAGGTRGAGRGIAVELGAAGATVYVTGRTTSSQTSEYGRPETIEETAALVTELGGEGVAVRVDHLVPDEVEALVARIRAERGRLDILVNDIWGGEHLFEWNKPVWEHNLENGLRLLRLAVDTHLITAHHALPLHDREARRPAGRGDRRHGGVQCGPLPPVGVLRSGKDGRHSHGLGARQGPCAPWRHGGLHHAGVDALRDDARQLSVSPKRTGATPRPSRRTLRFPNRRVSSDAPSPRSPPTRSGPAGPDNRFRAAGWPKVYGFTDLDGSQPDCWRYIVEVQDAGKPADVTGYR